MLNDVEGVMPTVTVKYCIDQVWHTLFLLLHSFPTNQINSSGTYIYDIDILSPRQNIRLTKPKIPNQNQTKTGQKWIINLTSTESKFFGHPKISEIPKLPKKYPKYLKYLNIPKTNRLDPKLQNKKNWFRAKFKPNSFGTYI